ncbi:hypothetical protein PG990_010369 [Apiospora arundinis]
MAFNPNARPFVPFRTMSDLSAPLTPLPTTPIPTVPRSSTQGCTAVISYHSCLCRKPEPLWACLQNPCDHKNLTVVVSCLPHACRAKTKAGSRSFKVHKDNGRTEACRAEDPANKAPMGYDVDAAGGLENLKLEPLPELAKNLDEVAPAFVEDGKCVHEEVQARYEKLRPSLNLAEEESAIATHSDNDNSDSDDDSDSEAFNSDSDSDSDPGVNSDDDDDDTTTPALNQEQMAYITGGALRGGLSARPAPPPAPIAPPARSRRSSSSASHASGNDSDGDSDADDEHEDFGDKKSKKPSLSSLVANSEPDVSKS